MGAKTLVSRLFILSALWAIVSISLVAFLLSNGYRDNAEEGLRDLLKANLYSLMANVEIDDEGKLTGTPDLRDARYQTFQSGFYWSVSEVANSSNKIASQSLVDGDIAPPLSLNFDTNFEREFEAKDDASNALIAIEAHVFLGEGDGIYSFKISGDKASIEEDVNSFVRLLLIYLSLFALGFILVTYFLLKLGLAPLGLISEKLSDIKQGKESSLVGDFPLEIQPLVHEANSLIKSNNAVIERARTQVGNLAHSLKTPLAVLKNEAGNAQSAQKKLIETQILQMQSQIQTYLDRARIAANVGTVTSRTDVPVVAEKFVRVMEKLSPNLEFSINYLENKSDLIFAGEQQDFEEMLGNLLENASNFAKAKVLITFATKDNNLIVNVEDDGKGMTKDQMAEALLRGKRLDESMPGSGLGLSIVKDIATEYGGQIELSQSSALKGLCVQLSLPK
ncbi:MAG: ATP-binding protein [Nitratireductor sp.]